MIEAAFDAINFYFAFTAVVIHAVFIVVVLTRTTRATVYRTFLFMCVSWIVWNFGIFMTHFYGEGFWFYVALTGSPMMPALLYHFIQGLCRPRARSAWVLVGYTLSGLLSVSSLLAIVHPGIKTFVDSVAWNVYFLGALFPFIIAGVALLVRTMRDAGPGEERDRLRYILWATVIGTLMGFTDLIQIFHVPVPKLGHLGSVIYSSVFAVGMFRHRASYDLIAQMRDRLDLLSEMAAGIAHEVRGPLGSIKGASRLLAAELGGDASPEAREYLEVIREEILRLDRILTTFHDLTRPARIDAKPLSVNDAVRKTVTLAEIASLPLVITQDLGRDLPLVQADASALKQVFLNLIKNAAEAGGGRCQLEIRTLADPGGVRIVFTDDGTGLPEEGRERIFEPFFSTKAAGMGVGLAVTRGIVQAHGGRIEARDAASGGAEFSVFLPVGAA